MNILVTSISAKVQLVELWRAALAPFPGAKLVGADTDPLSCARHSVDVFERLPSDGAADYGDALVDICKRHAIALIVPSRDNELRALAALRAPLATVGTAIPLPDEAALDICLDKRKFHDFCVAKGFPVLPRRDPVSEDDFPVFVRLTSSAGSRSAFLVPDLDIWRQLNLKGDQYICQPLCRDEEFSCDVLMDLDGNPMQAVARRRERIVYGESWRSQIVDDPELEKLALDICAALGLRGHNIVQAFRSRENGPNLIEVNARFGGCSNLSVTSGLASPERMLQMIAGNRDKAAAPRGIKYGLRSNRHARDIFEHPDR